MKQMFCMRGLSGSGKSTVASMLHHYHSYDWSESEAEQKVSIRSTDALFMVDGKYCFDQNKLGGYHQKNVWLVEQDCQKNVEVIIVDNTNVKARDMAPYRALAKKYGYSFTVIQVDCGLSESKKRNSQRSPDKKIPEFVLERQAAGMKTPIDLDKDFREKSEIPV